MKEHEWLRCEDPHLLLAHIRERFCKPVSDRKLVLIASGVCRQALSLLFPPSRKALEATEQAADVEHVDNHQLLQLSLDSEDCVERTPLGDSRHSAAWSASWCVHAARRPVSFVSLGWSLAYSKTADVPYVVQSAILRDIVSNPWKLPMVAVTPIPVPGGYQHRKRNGRLVSIGESGKIKMFPEEFITPSVLAIARRAYDENDFSGLLVLADALSEAGCDDEELLWHLRGKEPCPYCMVTESDRMVGIECRWSPCSHCNEEGWIPLRGPHVRGCHALDLILGKE